MKTLFQTSVKTTVCVGCETKYHGPTDHRGYRVSARHLLTGARLTRSWDDSLDANQNHARVAAELLGCNELLSVSVENGGYIFVKKV